MSTPGRRSRRRFLKHGALLGAAAVSGCLALGRSPERRVERHRDALATYRDVSTALEDGYRTSATYVRGSKGVLGTPFVNPDVEGLDPEQPNVLVYDLTEEGRYELLAAKWFRPADDVDGAPRLFGKELSGPLRSETRLIPEHYGLTAWLFRENPRGLFARYNPAIEPASLVSAVSTVRDALEPYRSGAQARKDGYVNTEKCVETPAGFYGVPYPDAGALPAGGTETSRPPILLYRLTSAWAYRLAGVEWYVPAEEAEKSPTLFGRAFHEPMDAHGSRVDQPRHYGLHAWLFAANPRGMFAPFNPALTC